MSLTNELLGMHTEDYEVRVIRVDDPARAGEQSSAYGIFNRFTDVREGVVSSLAMAVAYAHSAQAGINELKKNLDAGTLTSEDVPRVPQLN